MMKTGMIRGCCSQADRTSQVVENLLRGQSAALPLTQNLNVQRVRLGFSFVCALHLGLLVTFFNNLLDHPVFFNMATNSESEREEVISNSDIAGAWLVMM